MKVFGIAGWSGSGKTTLIEQLIRYWQTQGLRVSVIKHTHHTLDLDQPGKDSFRFREAGGHEVLLSSGQRWALLHENRTQSEIPLTEMLKRLSPCDLVLVEGYKALPIPKIEVFRAELGKPPLFPNDPQILALATPDPVDTLLPVLDLNQANCIADFITSNTGLSPKVQNPLAY